MMIMVALNHTCHNEKETECPIMRGVRGIKLSIVAAGVHGSSECQPSEVLIF